MNRICIAYFIIYTYEWKMVKMDKLVLIIINHQHNGNGWNGNYIENVILVNVYVFTIMIIILNVALIESHNKHINVILLHSTHHTWSMNSQLRKRIAHQQYEELLSSVAHNFM